MHWPRTRFARGVRSISLIRDVAGSAGSDMKGTILGHGTETGKVYVGPRHPAESIEAILSRKRRVARKPFFGGAPASLGAPNSFGIGYSPTLHSATFFPFFAPYPSSDLIARLQLDPPPSARS
jgi:hypothetical protein